MGGGPASYNELSSWDLSILAKQMSRRPNNLRSHGFRGPLHARVRHGHSLIAAQSMGLDWVAWPGSAPASAWPILLGRTSAVALWWDQEAGGERRRSRVTVLVLARGVDVLLAGLFTQRLGVMVDIYYVENIDPAGRWTGASFAASPF